MEIILGMKQVGFTSFNGDTATTGARLSHFRTYHQIFHMLMLAARDNDILIDQIAESAESNLLVDESCPLRAESMAKRSREYSFGSSQTSLVHLRGLEHMPIRVPLLPFL